MSVKSAALDALRRSQLHIRLNEVERELLATDSRGRVRIRFGSTRDRALRLERAELLAAIQRKDEILLDAWRRGVRITAQATGSTSARR